MQAHRLHRLHPNTHLRTPQAADGESGEEQGDEVARRRFQHHVLRLLKERHPDAAPASSPPALYYDTARDRAFLERVVGPLLGTHYIDLSWTVPLTRGFLEGVATR